MMDRIEVTQEMQARILKRPSGTTDIQGRRRGRYLFLRAVFAIAACLALLVALVR